MSLANRIFNTWTKGNVGKDDTESFETSFGFHTLVPKDAEALNIVDMIAIHGLNGHWDKTWKDEKTEVNWLRDCVKIKSARIMSFSYNSAVQFSKSTSDISVFADQLLEGLLASRMSIEEQARPIVFICHSLGGLVCKQALVRAHETERFLVLRGRVQGICFFGTPHRGSDMAKWATVLGAMLKAGSIGSSTNTDIAKDLLPRSRMLQSISKSFIERGRQLKIYSFYETQKMDFMNDVVVDRDSAVMGLENEVSIPIDGNHRTMCRFSSAREPRFQPVISNLVKLVEDCLNAQPSNPEDAVSNMLKGLANSNFRQHKDRNPSPAHGTCTWILRHPLYSNWLNRDESFLLWISADPGCGKSVLASHLIDSRMGLDKGTKVDICYFFFKSDYHEQRSGVIALQGLLRQLFNQQPALKSLAATMLRGQSMEDIDVLWKVFADCALRAQSPDGTSPRSTFCLLDGLDECDSVDRKKLTRIISHTFQSMSWTQTTPRNGENRAVLKMLVLSRPDNAIKVAFDKATSHECLQPANGSRMAMIRLRGEDETDAISADVSRVVDASVSDLIDQGLPKSLLMEVQAQLIRRADRTFLWVTLILQLLAEKVETGASRRELDSILETRDIDTVYAELLAVRTDVKARKMLSILLAATRPLTVSEMSIALAIIPDHEALKSGKSPRRPDSSTFKDLEYDLVYPFETHLKSICGNFVRIIHNKVYLVHETAREFLLEHESYDGEDHETGSPQWEDDVFASWAEPSESTFTTTSTHVNSTCSPWQHSFSILESEATMLQICTTFLYMLGKRCDVTELGQPSDRTRDFLHYAGQCWARHFAAVRDEIAPKDLRYYENLCHPTFPGFYAWTEALLGFDKMMHAAIGRSQDQVQDYYTKLLGIETTASTNEVAFDRDQTAEAETGGAEEQDAEGSDPLSVLANMTSYSSNPATQRNSHFPVRPDDAGFVGLHHDVSGRDLRWDFSKSPGNRRPQTVGKLYQKVGGEWQMVDPAEVEFDKKKISRILTTGEWLALKREDDRLKAAREAAQRESRNFIDG